ncbi:hypothetical protein HRbin01_01429 [archaeon HR01]|nr:hypothetical protein HRbin01_01429 [archaeon HR01]
MSEIADLLWQNLSAYGYLGVFAASLLGSLIPFLSGPYLLPIIFAVIAGRFDPFITAVASAAGAAIGKLVLFRGFKSGRALLKAEARRRMRPLELFLLRHGWIAVLAASATPLPDDMVYMPLAVANYSERMFLPLVFAGKLVMTLAVAYVALYWSGLICYLVECVGGQITFGTTLAIAAGTAVLAIAAAYLITRLDWSKLLTRYVGGEENEDTGSEL